MPGWINDPKEHIGSAGIMGGSPKSSVVMPSACRCPKGRGVSDLATSALSLLQATISDNHFSLVGVLTVYFEDNERKLDITIQALERQRHRLGPEGGMLIDELKSLSILKSTECLSDWNIESITKAPDRFRAVLKSCKAAGTLSATNFALLKSVANYLSARKQTAKGLRSVADRLGNLPETAAKSTVRVSEIDQDAKALLSFLGRYNGKARAECDRFIKTTSGNE